MASQRDIHPLARHRRTDPPALPSPGFAPCSGSPASALRSRQAEPLPRHRHRTRRIRGASAALRGWPCHELLSRHVSGVVCHGTVLRAETQASISSSVSWFQVKKSLRSISLQAPAALPGHSGVGGRSHDAEVGACPITSALALQPGLCQLHAWCLLVVLWLETPPFPAVLLPRDRFSLWTYLVFLLITLSPYLRVTLHQPPPLLFPCCGLDNNRKDLRACKLTPISDWDDPEVPGSPRHREPESAIDPRPCEQQQIVGCSSGWHSAAGTSSLPQCQGDAGTGPTAVWASGGCRQSPSPPPAPSAPSAAAGASLVSSRFPVLPPSGTDPGHPAPTSLRRVPRATPGSAGWARSSPPPRRASPLPELPTLPQRRAREGWHLSLATGETEAGKGPPQPPTIPPQCPAACLPPPQPPWGPAHGDRPSKAGSDASGQRVLPSPPERGGRRPSALPCVFRFLKASGGGGCVVFTGKAGKPR